MIERHLRLNHPDVRADWLDGENSASRTRPRDLHREVADVRADVDDRRVFRQHNLRAPEIRVQNRGFVHRRQVGGARSHQILRAVPQLEHDTLSELGQRHGPPVAIRERERDDVPRGVPAAGEPH